MKARTTPAPRIGACRGGLPGAVHVLGLATDRPTKSAGRRCNVGRESSDIPGVGHRATNNLGYGARNREVAELDRGASDVSHNSFDLPITLSPADFLSLDESELTAPRQPNGDLPSIRFLHLSPHSVAIDRGVDIGRPFHGRAPDLGAFEAPTASRHE